VESGGRVAWAETQEPQPEEAIEEQIDLVEGGEELGKARPDQISSEVGLRTA
jgi:hypothetical protein